MTALPPQLAAVEHLLEVQERLQQLAAEGGEREAELRRLADLVGAVVALLDEVQVPALPRLRSRIERLGLVNEVLRLREGGHSYSEIAERYQHLGISADMVRRFCRAYERLQSSERLQVRRQSIFETQERLEDICAMLYRLIGRLEVGQQDDVLVKAIGELRQTAALAQQVTKDLISMANYQHFKRVVLDLVREYVPVERRSELAQRLMQYRLLNQSLESLHTG